MRNNNALPWIITAVLSAILLAIVAAVVLPHISFPVVSMEWKKLGADPVVLVVTQTPQPTEKVVEVTPTVQPTATIVPTNTAIPTEVVEIIKLKTAYDYRSLGKINGWVSGGKDGEFVQGAQIVLYEDLDLLSLPNGVIWEHECTQYQSHGDKIVAEKVCDDAVIRFSTEASIVPAGTIGTFWGMGPVSGSVLEEWDEGFLNAPCICNDGDCRDE